MMADNLWKAKVIAGDIRTAIGRSGGKAVDAVTKPARSLAGYMSTLPEKVEYAKASSAARKNAYKSIDERDSTSVMADKATSTVLKSKKGFQFDTKNGDTIEIVPGKTGHDQEEEDRKKGRRNGKSIPEYMWKAAVTGKAVVYDGVLCGANPYLPSLHRKNPQPQPPSR